MDSAYASTFLGSLSTAEAAAVVRDRLQVNRNVHEELGDWFKEYQSLQQNYGRALLRLTERKLKFNSTDLGVTEPAWRRINEATLLAAREHIKAGDKTQEEVIRYFFNWEATTDTANVSSLERELSTLAKSIDQAESRQSKAGTSRFGNKATKQAEAEQELAQVKSRWSAEAPRVFENLQKLDERRVATFKDAMVRWQTSQIDLTTNLTKQSEHTIAQLLELNPTDEPMQVITARLAQGTMVPGVTPQQAQQQQSQPQIPPASRGSLSSPSLNRRTSQTDETGSVRSSGGAGSSLKSKFGTLLRGKRSTSPSKRKSILPGLGSNGHGPQRSVPEPVEEEPAARSPVVAAPAPATPVQEAPRPVAPTVAPAAAVIPRAIPEARPTAANDLDELDFSSETANFNATPVTTAPPVAFVKAPSVDNDTALNDVSSSLRAQSTISRRSGGRRELRNMSTNGTPNDFNGNGEARDVVRDVLGSPVAREDAAPFSTATLSPPFPSQSRSMAINRASSFSADNESIRSGRSATSSMTGLGAARHQEPSIDGVHLSVLETILFTSDTAANVTGEAALAIRNPIDAVPLQLTVKAPPTVSRLVANTQVLDRRLDEAYTLQPSSTPRMTALFKYQVDAQDSSSDRFQPILIDQKWTPEPSQTSVKLTLKLNSRFGASTVVLHDLEVHVALASNSAGAAAGVANSCVARPAGTFIKAAGKLVWKLGQSTFDHATQVNLLARFKTAELARPAESIELRWRTAPSTLALGSGFAVLAAKHQANPFGDELTPTEANVLVNNSYVVQSTRQLVPTAV